MIIQLNPSVPIVDESGRPTQLLTVFFEEVYRSSLIIGTGSPEGVLEAEKGQEYMDDSGSTGSIKYIKKSSDIGGDRKQGWILI